MNTATVTNGIKTEISKSVITLDGIKATENQKAGTLTAQLRQKVTTKKTYPSKKIDSNLQDNLFGIDDFGFASSDPFVSEENRVAWIPVPANATEATVKSLLDKANAAGAVIYKVLSNSPILDSNQEYAIREGLRTMDQFADTQAVRYPENAETIAASTVNQLVLDENGNAQYRRTFFSSIPKEDLDLRDASKTFVSQAIAAEMLGAGVFSNQTV